MERMQVFPERVRKFWGSAEIRVMVPLSLFLQTILNVFGSRRKSSRSTWIRIVLWIAYMSADWVATVSLSILATREGDLADNSYKATHELHSFWAPFLLLHLGGQDNITAYSLEDNELWLRHFLSFLVQVGVAFYAFLRSWSNNALTYLAIPVFVTGIIKYVERIWALRSSSTKRFRDSLLSPPDAGPDFVHITTIGMSQDELKEVKKAAWIVPEEEIRLEDNYIVQAYYLFKRFKYLFADLILGYYERKGSYSLINRKSAEDAFNLVAVELGFLYDVLYTKATIVYSRQGIIFRCISLFSSTCTSVTFLLITDLHAYQTIDINITYLLLVGALILEMHSLRMHILSDWTKLWSIKAKVPQVTPVKILIDPVFSTNPTPTRSSWANVCKSWSGSIAQYNLMDFCLKEKQGYFVGVQKLFCIHETLERHHCRTWIPIEVDLQKVIFKQLQEKGNKVKDESFDLKICKQILVQRGDYALDKRACLDRFRWCTVDVEFDQSLLLWHIATDLCYDDDINHRKNSNRIHAKCKTSKQLSDYMLYLLVMCPTMLPKGIGEIRYRDTCAEARRFYKQKSEVISNDRSKACEELLKIDTSLLAEIKGDKSKSLLFNGCSLAKQFQSLESEQGWGYKRKWEMISEVWVELLTYAANHCDWKEHGQQLRRGGELLTHVSLLMTHLGLSEQYQIQEQCFNEINFFIYRRAYLNRQIAFPHLISSFP